MRIVSALVLMSVFSSSLLAINVRRGFKFAGGDVNVDGTIVLRRPELSRGKFVYPISSSSGATNMCKVLGYKNYLPDTLISYRSAGSNGRKIVELYNDGTFRRYLSADYNNAIDEIICYNSRRHLLKISGKHYNDDGSITIYNPELSRGKYTYSVSSSSGFQNLCKVMGFGDYMPDSGLTRRVPGVNGRRIVELYNDGTFRRYLSADYNGVTSEITCFGDNHVDLIIDENGVEYISRSGVLLSASGGSHRPNRPVGGTYTPIPSYDELIVFADDLKSSLDRLEMLSLNDRDELVEQIERVEDRAHVKIDVQTMRKTLIYLEGLFEKAINNNDNARALRSLQNMKKLVKNVRHNL